MNRAQLVVLWAGLLLVVAMVIYPPWVPTTDAYRRVGERVRYCPIWRDPEKICMEKNYGGGLSLTSDGEDRYGNLIPYGTMSFRRLGLQVALVGGITGCLIVTLRSKNGRRKAESDT